MKLAVKKRVDQKLLRVNLTDWTLEALDDWQNFTDKLHERITRETSWDKIAEKFQNHIRKAAAEALEIAIAEGFIVYFSGNAGDVNLTFVLKLDAGDDSEAGPMFELSLAETIEYGASGYEPELAKAFRALADKLDKAV
jgi:hypothetical protein